MNITILEYLDGKYAAMDHSSGGYPYQTENIFEAYQWQKRKIGEFERYMKSFPELIRKDLTITISASEATGRPL